MKLKNTRPRRLSLAFFSSPTAVGLLVTGGVLAGSVLACNGWPGSEPTPLPEDPSTVARNVESTPDPKALEEARLAVLREQQALEEQQAQLRLREQELAAKEELARREEELAARERAAAERQRVARAEADAKARREAELGQRERDLAAERAALEAEKERLAAEAAAQAERQASEPESEPTDVASTSASRSSDAWTGDESWRNRRPEGAADRTPEPAPVAGRLRAGMQLEVEILEKLSSRTSQVGDTFRTALARDVLDSRGDVIVPAGSELIGTVVEARPLRKVGGQAALGLEFHRLIVGPEHIDIEASFVELGKNQKKDKGKIAAGAVAGAILGRILGDGDAAIVGGIVGAAAGTAAVMSSKGEEVELPAGTTVTLELNEVVSSTGRYGPVARPPS